MGKILLLVFQNNQAMVYFYLYCLRLKDLKHFNCSHGIAFNPNGTFYVSDHNNHRIL